MQISATPLAAYAIQSARGTLPLSAGGNAALPSAFGPAYLRGPERRPPENSALYGPNGRPRESDASALRAGGALLGPGVKLRLVRQRGDDDGGEDLPGTAVRGADGQELTAGEEAQLEKLRQRDAKVRAHESAHVMAAGGQAGLPTYTYQTGPDGRRYAIGGAVNISTLRTGDPEQDARQAATTRRAALAAGEASGTDMQTAASAGNMAMRARSRALERYAEAAVMGM